MPICCHMTEETTMIATRRTFGSFPVDDINAARRFYGETLGMGVSVVGEHGPIWVRGSDGQETLIYLKPDHVPASFTVFNLSVERIDQVVDELSGLGVPFQRYEGLEADDRGIFHGEGHAVAWFNDPAGNILSV